MDFERLTPIIDDTARVEAQQKKRVEYTLIGSERRVVGHRMFEYNKCTYEVKEARIIESDTIDFMTLKPTHNPRIDAHKNCIYI